MTRAVVAQGIAKKQQRELEHFADVHELVRAEGRRTCVCARPTWYVRSASAQREAGKNLRGVKSSGYDLNSDEELN